MSATGALTYGLIGGGQYGYGSPRTRVVLAVAAAGEGHNLFQAELAPPHDATPTHRLMAFLGRRPT